MAITLSAAYLAELKKGKNTPDTVLEVLLDSATVFWGYYATTTDVKPIVKSVSSLQNKLDQKTGYTTRGQITVVITGRDNFKSLVSADYLKNRRVIRKDGFLGIAYTDYAATFQGRISDWSRKGDELTLTISDDFIEAVKKVPVETAAKTQYLDYTNSNPVNVMTNLLLTQLGIGAGYVDSTQFTTERDNWLAAWTVSRVITEPKEAGEYLHELQTETNSFIVHDGEKISFKVFAPPLPTVTVEEWTDDSHILKDSLSVQSGYKDAFFNRVVVYYDYDESGNDKEDAFEAAAIDSDTVSQGSAVWDEEKTKVIKSKWIRSYTFSHAAITGTKPYHVSANNGAGAGTITYTYDAGGQHTLQWTPPGDTIGAAVTISKDGKYQVYGADTTKYIRILITHASLPGSNTTGSVTITAINGATLAITLARKILNRYRDPAASVKFSVDINNAAYNSTFIKPSDLKDLTTDDAFEYGDTGWNAERVMLTSVRANGDALEIEAIETKQYHIYGFIAPSGYPDYGSATAEQKKRAFIRNAAIQYFIW